MSNLTSKFPLYPDAVPTSDAYTFYISDVFKNYDDFLAQMNEMLIWTTNLNQNGYDHILLEQLYIHITRHYNNVNIRYTCKQDFINALAEVLDNVYLYILRRKDIITQLSNINLDDVQTISTMLNSYADAPNYNVRMDQMAEYITNQNYTKQEQSKFLTYLDIINNTPNFDIQKILEENGINNLFMQVIPNKITYYGGCN